MKRLIVGSLNYSSWSARPWLALTHAGIEFRTHLIELFVDPKWREKLLQFSGAAKVPVLIDGSLSVHESLAICEYVAELAPDAGLWPADTALRARARAISCEMVSGFQTLRNELPTNVRARATRFVPSEQARAEIARVFDIWSASLQSSGGPFLFGHFTIADCMYAPVATRFRTYGIELSADAVRYSEALWQQPAVRQWEQVALQAPAIPTYDAMVP
jgi:glutathione S-transferase